MAFRAMAMCFGTVVVLALGACSPEGGASGSGLPSHWQFWHLMSWGSLESLVAIRLQECRLKSCGCS